MQITVEEINAAMVVKISGHMGHAAMDEVTRVFDECLGKCPKKLILDMGNLQYISSAGLRCLFNLVAKVNNLKGKLILCCMQQEVRQVFDVSGFTSFFSICDTMQAALKQP